MEAQEPGLSFEPPAEDEEDLSEEIDMAAATMYKKPFKKEEVLESEGEEQVEQLDQEDIE